jgi:hypothetical protein
VLDDVRDVRTPEPRTPALSALIPGQNPPDTEAIIRIPITPPATLRDVLAVKLSSMASVFLYASVADGCIPGKAIKGLAVEN